jgi:hypothetical protein
VRLWKIRVDEQRVADYESLARELSLPMFRRQPGYCRVAMFRRGQDCLVLTLWKDRDSVGAQSTSKSCAEAVSQINSAGFLLENQSVELFDLHLFAGIGGESSSSPCSDVLP